MISVLCPPNHKLIEGAKLPLFVDLNIDQIIDCITEDWDEETKDLYYLLPLDIETERYRKDFWDELIMDDYIESLDNFQELMKYRSTCLKNREDVEEKVQKQVWFLKETIAYVDSVELLHKCLERDNHRSEAFTELKKFIEEYRKTDYYDDLLRESKRLEATLKGFNIAIVYENDRITIEAGSGKYEYEDHLNKVFSIANDAREKNQIKSPFASELDMSYLESRVLELFGKKNKDFLLDLSAYNKVFGKYLDEQFIALEKEIKLYLSFYKFMKKMEAKGFCFCNPKKNCDKLSAEGLYDLALACASLENEKPVIDNDIFLKDNEKFLVLTGPNQGGKTTFARSLGQMVYLAKMGLNVAARSCEMPFYEEILTHFSVEESVESGKGKLMDELTRLKPMMKKGDRPSFVIINELFTTAANYDAVEMGKRVLKYFTNNNCQGIYVTHLGELTSCCDGLVSLRAMLDSDRHQTFKIQRGDYEEFSGPNNLIEKYGLTYEKIMERLA